jgi:extracellular factor (EF) 3-hydroxypalmitic acid methyl ester biosynthesis protein
MHDERFFDSTLALLERGAVDPALHMLVGCLHAAKADERRWQEARGTYMRHPLRARMLEDPYIARAVHKPRGYAGDAELIEMIYSRRPPEGTSPLGLKLFDTSIGFTAAEAVRLRRDYAQMVVEQAHGDGKRVLSLACGHFGEGRDLIGKDLSGFVLVDQDTLSLGEVRRRYGAGLECHEANVFSYLRTAAARGERFDLVYTLGLTDYLDERAMQLLHRMVKAVLKPGGTFLLANFMPMHLAIGWLDAVMEWHLIYREPQKLLGYATAQGFSARTWVDPTGIIAWCEMQALA